MRETTFPIPRPFHLQRTTRALGVGSWDPDGTWWWASHRPCGLTTVAIRALDDRLAVSAWGDGAVGIIGDVPTLLGFDEDPIEPSGAAAGVLERAAGLRLGATKDVHEALVTAVLGQQVTTKEAKASLRAVTRGFGETSPGPNTGLVAVPAPSILAALSHEDLHPFGIERRRADLLIEVSRRHDRLSEILAMSRTDAYRRLEAIRGVGPWTSAMVMGSAWGDRDAVPVGDYHLANSVAWALAGEERASDERMLELLEPYRPFRRRVLVSVKQAGVHAPRYGPRSPVRRHL